MLLWHVSPISNQHSILSVGLSLDYALCRPPRIWAVRHTNLGWAIRHCASRHGVGETCLAIFRINASRKCWRYTTNDLWFRLNDVPRGWLELWYTTEQLPGAG